MPTDLPADGQISWSAAGDTRLHWPKRHVEILREKLILPVAST